MDLRSDNQCLRLDNLYKYVERIMKNYILAAVYTLGVVVLFCLVVLSLASLPFKYQILFFHAGVVVLILSLVVALWALISLWLDI